MAIAISGILKSHLDENPNPGLIVEALAKASIIICNLYDDALGKENVNMASLFLDRFFKERSVRQLYKKQRRWKQNK